jgi:hypothetical protein
MNGEQMVEKVGDLDLGVLAVVVMSEITVHWSEATFFTMGI